MDTVLEVNDLVKCFPEVRAVDGISFSVPRGICFGLLGPNGAGKTTTIEMIEGILPPTKGKILYKGKLRGTTFSEDVGIQLQNTELPILLTVRETLQTFRSLYKRRKNLDDLIVSCRLEDILARDNQKISGGQRQRLLLALALTNDPELVFLDEPTTGLDPQARRYLWDIVNKIKADNKTIILTTHYMEEAHILCDLIAIMDNGKIIAMGSPGELLDEHCKGISITIKGEKDVAEIKGLPGKAFRVHGNLEIQTDSLNECIKILIDHGVDLSAMTVRSQNLEDLFLQLTGKQIRN